MSKFSHACVPLSNGRNVRYSKNATEAGTLARDVSNGRNASNSRNASKSLNTYSVNNISITGHIEKSLSRLHEGFNRKSLTPINF
jgi:hypothetical protein